MANIKNSEKRINSIVSISLSLKSWHYWKYMYIIKLFKINLVIETPKSQLHCHL